MWLSTSLTSAWVGTVPLPVKRMLRLPSLWLKVAKVWPPLCNALPLTVKPAPLVLMPSTSSALRPPRRASVRLAPL